MVDKDLADKDMPDTRSSPFWHPKVHADRRPALLARGRIVGALRAWFAAEDFVEVETGALQVSPGNEMHLHAFATALVAPDGARSDALSAYLAGIRLQEAARGGRTPHRRIRKSVPQPRARRAACAGIHAGRMVSRGRALSDADGRLRRDFGASGARRRARKSSAFAAASRSFR